jgi:hypothetical protein
MLQSSAITMLLEQAEILMETSCFNFAFSRKQESCAKKTQQETPT